MPYFQIVKRFKYRKLDKFDGIVIEEKNSYSVRQIAFNFDGDEIWLNSKKTKVALNKSIVVPTRIYPYNH
jgi:hypothetical protein